MTGAAGKIGSKVVPELVKHGHSVRALDRRPLPAELRGLAEPVYADLTDPLAMLNAVHGCDRPSLSTWPTRGRSATAEEAPRR